jgi:hypothetical protein
MEPELRSEEGAEGLASSAGFWSQTRGTVMRVHTARRRWREGKVRPIPGNSPPAQPVSWGVCPLRRVCDDPFSATPLLQLPTTSEDPRNAFGEACGIYRSDVSSHLINLGRGAASRSGPSQAIGRAGRNAPCPSSAMSSGRLFLDRVARQHCPSPLHRHGQITTHPHPASSKQDISTVRRIGHFYLR